VLATAITVVEIALVIGVSSWIALEKRPPVATLAWILLVTLLPIAGPIVYYLIGYRRVKRSRLKRLRARLAAQREVLRAEPDASARAPLGGRARQLMTLGTTVCSAPPATARSLTLLVDGDETIAAIEAAIRAAKHHVHLEYYIFEPDQTGTRLRDLLIERAKAGIEVRLLCDGVGSMHLTRRFLAPLRAAGVKFAWFGPVRLARLRPRLVNFRTHRKIVVVDGTVAFTGGINVTDDEMPSVRGERAYRDTHLRIEGAAARWLQIVFLEDWAYAAGHAPTDAAYFPEAEEGAHAVQISPPARTSRGTRSTSSTSPPSTRPSGASWWRRPTSCPTRRCSPRSPRRRSAAWTSSCSCRGGATRAP
jgi:cardiolipin synthase